MTKRLIGLVSALCLLVGLSSCKPQAEEQYIFAMDTVMTLRLEGDDGTAFALCEAELRRLEGLFSVTDPKSELSRLNGAGNLSLSADTAALLEAGKALSAETKGAFSLSLYPASRLWGFTAEVQQVPSASALEAVRPLIGDEKILLDGQTATLPAGAALDAGGIAKGYAADRLAAVLAEQGIGHYFLSLGGNVQVGGGNPNGSPWRIGVADPAGGDPVGVITLADGAVVTSGGYQRNFTADGKTYHHILDPATLCPAESGLLSATVITAKGTDADALSTALFVMGERAALQFCGERAELECILITEDGRVVLSQGLKDRYTHLNENYRYDP